MSEILPNLKYTKEHEWVLIDEDNHLVMGITDHAQQQLGDIVYVGLPQQDSSMEQGDTVLVIESVKAASDIYMPVTGTIIAVNQELDSNPALINQSPYDKGWLVKIASDQAPQLLTADEYAELIDSNG